MENNYLHTDITKKIIRAFYNVYNTLGYGFLEKVYENALVLELLTFDLRCSTQIPIDVLYKDYRVGFYVADINVEDKVIVELKVADAICEEHEAILTNYLRATEIEVGLLLNFGKEPAFKRKVFTNEYKQKSKS
jgi:GxxExxY protein